MVGEASNNVTPERSILEARILMVSLVARYRTWLWRRLVQVRNRLRLSVKA